MRYNLEVAAPQLKLAALAMGLDVRNLPEREAALAAIEATEALKRAIGVPLRLRDTSLDRALFPAIAEHALVDRGLFFNPRPTSSASAVIGLLEEAW